MSGQHNPNQIFEEPPRPRRFPLVRFCDVEPDRAPAYLVKEMIPRQGLSVAWGAPKSGKSFWAFDAAMHVALGWPYRGRTVHQGAVVYLAVEGGHGFKTRIAAYRQHHGLGLVEDPPFFLMPARLAMVADHAALIAELRDQLGETMPALVVIDTLNRSFSGSESSDEDMTAYIAAADALLAAFACAVLIVHHCGLDGSRPRGHTSLTGAVDAQLAVKRSADREIITTTVEHMKDGPEGAEAVSRLVSVNLGTDDDGDQITSCVIIPADDAAHDRPAPKLTAPMKLVLGQLEALIAEHGELLPASRHTPSDRTKRGVRSDLWRETCIKASIAESDKADTRAKAFKRAADKLKEAGFIGVWEPWVWLTGQAGQGRT